MMIRLDAIPESKSKDNMDSKDPWGHPEPRKLRDVVILSHLARLSKNITLKTISYEDIAIQFLHDNVNNGRALQILNGSLVSLSTVSDTEKSFKCSNGLAHTT